MSALNFQLLNQPGSAVLLFGYECYVVSDRGYEIGWIQTENLLTSNIIEFVIDLEEQRIAALLPRWNLRRFMQNNVLLPLEFQRIFFMQWQIDNAAALGSDCLVD